MLVGFGGVFILIAPKLGSPANLVAEVGSLMILGSALAWAVGSVLAQRLRQRSSLVLAAYQMLLGGGEACGPRDKRGSQQQRQYSLHALSSS